MNDNNNNIEVPFNASDIEDILRSMGVNPESIYFD
jgi:hypothetical protein